MNPLYHKGRPNAPSKARHTSLELMKSIYVLRRLAQRAIKEWLAPHASACKIAESHVGDCTSTILEVKTRRVSQRRRSIWVYP